MSYNPPYPPGQTTKANSEPVVVASDQELIGRIVNPMTLASGVNISGEVLSRVVNPVTVSSGVTVSGTVGGTVQVIQQNNPTYIDVFNKGGQVVVASGVTSTSGTFHALIDNFPTNFTTNVRNVNGDAQGNWGVNIQNTPAVTVNGEVITRQVNPVTVASGVVVNGEVLSRVVNPITIASGVTIIPPIQQNVTISGSYGEQLSRIVNPVTVASGVSVNGEVFARIVNPITVASGVAVNGEILSRVVNPVTVASGVSVNGEVLGRIVNPITVASGIISDNQVRDLQGSWHDVGFRTADAMIPVTMSGITASGINHILIDNFPSGFAINQLPAVTSTSGNFRASIDNFPTNMTVNVRNANVQADGTWATDNSKIGGTPITSPWMPSSGVNQQPTYRTNQFALKSINGSLGTAGRTTVVSGQAGQYIKVYAFSFRTAATTGFTATILDEHSAQAWSEDLQAITGTYFGANLSVGPPAYLFRTSTQGDGLAINLSAAQTLKYGLSYWYDQNPI